MKKKLYAAAALTFCALFAGAGAAQATTVWDEPATSLGNKPSSWGPECSKKEFSDGVKTYDLDDDYQLVIVKAGRTNTIYEHFSGGFVSSMSGKDISHIIVCDYHQKS